MMIFHFRLLSDESEDFLLDVEVPYDMNLLDFQKFLSKTLSYNPCEIASFFTSDSEWEKLREFTLIDMGVDSSEFDPETDDDEMASPVAMEKVTLGQIMHKKFDRLIYVFDMFAERGLFIQLLHSKKADETTKYPRVVEFKGIAPVQITNE
ncbi:MAG: hypothetical protein RR066_00510 [Mucinivorans sp.]